MDVEAVVKKVSDKIESCTQQDVELHVTQVWVVSHSDTQLPLQIEVPDQTDHSVQSF